MTWTKIAKNTSADGVTVITYRLNETPQIVVQSRKRPLKHANGIGSWMYTSYFVVVGGKEIAEKHTLADAKKLAEKLFLGGRIK